MLQVSKHVLTRPQLLEYFIRSQFTDILMDTDCDEYSKQERNEALWYVIALGELRHENPADTLQGILQD